MGGQTRPVPPQGADGLPADPRHLLAARHVLTKGDVKYFLSNAPADTPVETRLWVALSRHRVERLFQDQKTELGLDHYEGRKYGGLIRHLLVTLREQAVRIKFEGFGGR